MADESTFYQKIKIMQIFVLAINVRENTFQKPFNAVFVRTSWNHHEIFLSLELIPIPRSTTQLEAQKSQ